MNKSEARFTKPRLDCPNPHYWTSEDSDSTENEVLKMLYGLIRGLQPDFVIETGSAFGFGSYQIGMALKKNGHGRLVTLEPVENRHQATAKRVKGLPVTPRHQSSMNYTPEEEIDFAFFDSLFQYRAAEFKLYYPYMKSSTIVAFHDTGPQHPLKPDIDALAAEGLITPIYLPTPRGIAIAEVHKNG